MPRVRKIKDDFRENMANTKNAFERKRDISNKICNVDTRLTKVEEHTGGNGFVIGIELQVNLPRRVIVAKP